MDRVDYVRLATGAVVIVVALLHLGHQSAGFPALVAYTFAGNPVLDPRPLAFTLSSVAIIVGVLATWNNIVARRPAYLAGIAVMVVYVTGYVLWHATGHGGFWPYLDGHHHHDMSLIAILYDHLSADRYALAAKILELLAISLLSYLYIVDGRRAD